MELHEALAALARDHGRAVFSDAAAFRGALDDYLDEGIASTGTINLLTDAVRLGALDSMMSMLDTGAQPESAVDTAGRRLARDRGSADVTGSQWACAVLGYALGRVPEAMAVAMHPDRPTAQPPAPPAPPTAAYGGAPQQAWGAPGQGPAPQQQPWGAPAAPYPPKKSRTGLIVALAAIASVLVIGVIIAVVALSGGDEDPVADDAQTTETTDSPTDDGTTKTPTTGEPSDLGGPVISGDGYAFSVPSEWTDGTDDLQAQPGGETIDAGALWGEDFNSARANVLVESATAFGQENPEDLREDWINNLESSTGATPDPVEGVTIGGSPSVGVELIWENPAGITVHQVAYLTVHDGNQYSIAVTTRQGDDEALQVYQDILATWVWQ